MLTPPASASPNNSTSASRAPDPYLLQTQVEIIKSSAILNEVVKRLALDSIFAKQLGTDHLTQDEACLFLQKRMKVQQTRNTQLIEIWVYDTDKNLAAQIANQIAFVYTHGSEIKEGSTSILDMAKPGLHPASPNIPFNIVFGFIGSLILACAFGAAAGFAIWIWGRIPSTPRVKQNE
jgi:capsular polysaccharide biosynthesis protein